MATGGTTVHTIPSSALCTVFVNNKEFAIYGAFLLSVICSDVAVTIIPSVPSLGLLNYPSRVFSSHIDFISLSHFRRVCVNWDTYLEIPGHNMHFHKISEHKQ